MSLLTHYRLCPVSRAIRLALAELGMPVDLAEEHPLAWRPQFLALNPSGDLPVLQLADGLVIAGGYAIAEYLSEMTRGSPLQDRTIELFPGGADDRTEVRRLVDWFHGKLDREATRDLLRERVHARTLPGKAGQAPDSGLLRAIRSNIRYHMSYVAYLADQRRWLAGDDLSYADLAAASHLSCLDYIDEVPWSAYPSALRWYRRLKSRPSFRPLLADRVAGLSPPAQYDDLDF